MNVIGDESNLHNLTERLLRVFGDVHILATDPNYYFYSRKCCDNDAAAAAAADVGVSSGGVASTRGVRGRGHVSPDELMVSAAKAGLSEVSGDCLDLNVATTERHRRNETLIGWLAADEFLDRCTREVV